MNLSETCMQFQKVKLTFKTGFNLKYYFLFGSINGEAIKKIAEIVIFGLV